LNFLIGISKNSYNRKKRKNMVLTITNKNQIKIGNQHRIWTMKSNNKCHNKIKMMKLLILMLMKL